MEKLTTLENSLYERELKRVVGEFNKASDIINNVLGSLKTDNIGVCTSDDNIKDYLMFGTKYTMGRNILIAGTILGATMPDCLKEAIKNISVENFLKKIDDISEITDDL